MFNLEYVDAVTNTEGILKLRKLKDLNPDVRHTFIGINLVAKSLVILPDPYRDKHDFTSRVRDSLTIANGLSEIVEMASQPNFDSYLYIEELKERLISIFGDPTNKYGIRANLISSYLNEVCMVVYNSGRKYEEIGTLIEKSFINEKGSINDDSIKDHLMNLRKLSGRLKHYTPEKTDYKNLLVEIDKLKAKTLSREESIMKRKLVNLLGLETA